MRLEQTACAIGRNKFKTDLTTSALLRLQKIVRLFRKADVGFEK
jgi:hypothetical protein